MSDYDRGETPPLGDTAERPVVRGEEPVFYDQARDDSYDEEHDDYVPRGGSRRAERRRSRLPGCLAALVAIAVVVAGLWFGVSKVMDKLDGIGGGGGDYSGQAASGSVTFEVKAGDSAAAIGRNLKAAGVVKSVDAFISAANDNPAAAGIQVGFYSLKKEMSADQALAVLVDPKNIVTTSVTVPEGLRVADTVAILVKKTKFKKADFEKALKSPAIGLPAYAKGNPEGFLFPATYGFGPNAKPVDMIKAMVSRWKQSVGDNDVDAIASQLGRTPEEIMTVASLVQAEGRGDDMAKVARVIYNRLDNPGTAGTTGKLQIDATVLYALGRDGNSPLTQAEIESTDSPYNTYANVGLPPGPISNPGDQAIQAALHPADGDWYYYVTVNLRTGETKFAETYDQFLQYKAEYQNYCATESDRC
jgi:UPF0755 protein